MVLKIHLKDVFERAEAQAEGFAMAHTVPRPNLNVWTDHKTAVHARRPMNLAELEDIFARKNWGFSSKQKGVLLGNTRGAQKFASYPFPFFLLF